MAGHADVDISQGYRYERSPSPFLVLLVESGNALPLLIAVFIFRTREIVEISSDQVSTGMAAECVTGEQDTVEDHHYSENAHMQTIVIPYSLESVVPQDTDDRNCEIERISV